MKLIIGGAYQGKLAYAQDRYDVKDGWADGAVCPYDEIETCKGMFQFHEFIHRIQRESDVPEWMKGLQAEHALELEKQAEVFAEVLIQKNPEILIVTNELGCGVVPMERSDRVWRETTGRVCTCLAAKADEVVRVICGVGMKLK